MLSSASAKLPYIRRLNLITRKLNAVERKSAVRDFKSIAKSDDFKQKFQTLSSTAVAKYYEIIRWDEIDNEYKKVTHLQEDLAKVQAERMNLSLQINKTMTDLSNLQTEIQDYKRGQSKYIELMKKEFEIVQEKSRLEEKFEIVDSRERQLFTYLQAKINLLHEISKKHTRQWGIISTIVGAVLGIIATSISAYYRNNDIRRVQQNFQQQFQEQIEQITKDTKQIIDGYENLMDYLAKFEMTLKPESKDIPKSTESWGSYIKRKTVAIYRWCTFQKS